MKQLTQSLQNGAVELADVPAPLVKPGHVLIANHRSLVSLGTERMLLDFGKAGWLEKAKSQPEKVKQVIQKAEADGIAATAAAVLNKLDQPLPLGYSSAGVVLDVGAGVSWFKPGDRVVSNGPHAQLVNVPVNLCAKIPDVVIDENASAPRANSDRWGGQPAPAASRTAPRPWRPKEHL